MNKYKRFISAATLFLMLAASADDLEGQVYDGGIDDNGGYGYYESSTVPSLTTEIALGTVAIVAIVAIAIRHGHHGHSHGHSHSSSS